MDMQTQCFGVFGRILRGCGVATVLLQLAAIAGTANAQPSNDVCTGVLPAIPATGGEVFGTIEGATRDGAACDGVNNSGVDVWYTFTPAVSGRYQFTLCDTNPRWNSVLSVHPSCPTGPANNNSISCNNDGCVTFNDPNNELSNLTTSRTLVAGTTYYVRVANVDIETQLVPGDFHMVVYNALANVACCSGGFCFLTSPSICGREEWSSDGTCSPTGCSDAPPVNNVCSSPTELFVRQARYGSTKNATTEVSMPNTLCGGAPLAGGGRDVFFVINPEISAFYTITTCGSSFRTTLSIHSDCPASVDNALVCNALNGPICGQYQSASLTIFMDAGVTHYLRLAGYGDGSPSDDFGLYSLYMDYLEVPTSGACCVAGACSIVENGTCAGEYKGDGKVCNPMPCGGASQGVCCVGATCVTSAEANCTGQYASFASAATCNATGNTVTPCCHANYNKVDGINVQDIFDYLSDWFEQRPRANIVSNGVGAPTVDSIFAFLNAWFAGGC